MNKKQPIVSKKTKKILEENDLGIKLDIGCGQNKQPGFVGLDVRPFKGVDIVQDVETFPWPLPDECASVALASHLVEHIDPAHGTFLKFMDEVWRILKPGGQFLISHPYAGSPGFWQDPTHCNGISHITWTYFDPLAKDGAGNIIGLYNIYRVRPWKIVKCTYEIVGNLEIILEKRKWDKSYGEAY